MRYLPLLKDLILFHWRTHTRLLILLTLIVVVICGSVGTVLLYRPTAHEFSSTLPGQQIWKKSVSSYLFGANDASWMWPDLNMGTNLAIRATIKAAGITLIRSPLTAVDAFQRVNAIGQSGAQCLGVLNVADLADAQRVVQTLGAHCRLYEIGNEPDANGISALRYAAAWNQLVPRLRRLNPQAIFIGPATANVNLSYIQQFLSSVKGDPPDVVSWHLYPCTDQSISSCSRYSHAYSQGAQQVAGRMQQTLGYTLPQAITEWNYSWKANQAPYDDPFMQQFTIASLQDMASAGVVIANQFDIASNSGGGTLDMVDAQTGQPLPQLVAMRQLIAQYGGKQSAQPTPAAQPTQMVLSCQPGSASSNSCAPAPAVLTPVAGLPPVMVVAPDQTPAAGVGTPPPTTTPIATTAAMENLSLPALSPNTELDNPQRGPQYYGNEAPPPGWPLADRYDRWCWSDLEPTPGQYNFSLIDQGLAAAAAAGYTFGFRIMPAVTNPCLPKGLSLDYGPQYLAAAQALYTELGRRYSNDPRLGWLDMSLYGCFGEWNQSEPGCNKSAPVSVQEQIIDLQVQAFPNKLFLMLTDNQQALDYALNLQRPYPIGVRIDCLGHDNLGGSLDTLNADSLARNRWQVAPLYFEYCGGADFQSALNAIQTFHATTIGDGANNIQSFSSYSAQNQSLMQQNYRISGYRFALNGLSLPSQLIAGGTFSVSTSWSNGNLAPAYYTWDAMIQLRNDAGQVVWQDRSSLDLKKLLPTGDGAGHDVPLTVTDQFTLPATVASGTYHVAVQVVDPNHYYRPLALANQGIQTDRSYLLGSVTVQ
ncbi:MAG TPA: DUF4832 domain-containing protein [Ktedonosporobacter sp.]|nr:DUF4832 domain-containing protein [Ktedonosporobacter sp.]